MDRNIRGLIKSSAASVALLAEGVGRNLDVHPDAAIGAVALLAEGVDRNINEAVNRYLVERRPPRGGRG